MARLSDTPVHLPVELANQIIDHAREGKPEEICGVLRGQELTAHELIRGENIAEDRVNNYTVDPQTLLLQFKFEEEGDEMMGIYHSHPISVAYPSATDAWNAYYPDSIYFICSLEFDDVPVIRAFRMITHFLDVDLAAITQTIPFDETRPGLFAHYQDTATPPPILQGIADSIALPFYLVYSHGEQDHVAENPMWDDVDVRVVELIEHPIVGSNTADS